MAGSSQQRGGATRVASDEARGVACHPLFQLLLDAPGGATLAHEGTISFHIAGIDDAVVRIVLRGGRCLLDAAASPDLAVFTTPAQLDAVVRGSDAGVWRISGRADLLDALAALVCRARSPLAVRAQDR